MGLSITVSSFEKNREEKSLWVIRPESSATSRPGNRFRNRARGHWQHRRSTWRWGLGCILVGAIIHISTSLA